MKSYRYFIVLGLVGIALFSFKDALFRIPKSDQLSVRVDPHNDANVIFTWTGAIDPPMARDLSEEFDLWKDKSSRIIIELDSPGGSVDEGERVISVLSKIKRTHSLQTFVGPERDCLSMCVPIYMQGKLRIASASSNWMFHEPRLIDPLTGKDAFSYEYELNQSAVGVFYQFFKRSDMNPKWRDNLGVQIQFGEVWKTGRELKDERANIVMVVE